MKIYQNACLGKLHREVNRLGWDAAAKQYPEVRAYLDASVFGSERWQPEYFAHYKYVARIETNDLNKAFEIGNIGPENMIYGMLDHSVSVGDILENDGTFFMVDSVGFAEIRV